MGSTAMEQRWIRCADHFGGLDPAAVTEALWERLDPAAVTEALRRVTLGEALWDSTSADRLWGEGWAMGPSTGRGARTRGGGPQVLGEAGP